MIRPYQPSDRPAVIELFRLNTPEYFAPQEEAELLHYLEQEVEDYFVVEEAGQIVGAGGCNYGYENDATARISWDFIHPDHHGKGIGARLIQYRIGRIKKRPGIRRIVVRTSQLAYGFYAKMGFTVERIEQDYWAEGFDLYLMAMEVGGG